MSSHELYVKLGYSGHPSKTFRECIDKLLKDEIIAYVSNVKQDSNNVLFIKKLKMKK